MEYFKQRKITKLLKKAAKQGLNSAIMTYEKVLSINPDLPVVYNYIGLCYFELMDYDKAESYFHQSIERFNDAFKSQHEVYYNLAFTLQSKDKNKEAEKYYKMAINLNKDYRFAYKNYAYLLFQEKRYKEAMEKFKAYNSFGEEAEVHNNIGIIYEELGKKEKAIASYEKAIELDESYALAYNNLGVIYIAEEKYNDACKLFDEAIKQDYTLIDAYNNYASVLVLDKKYNLALDLYQRGLKISPKHSILLLNLAKVYSYLKDKNNVINTLKRVLASGVDLETILKIEEFKDIKDLDNQLTTN